MDEKERCHYLPVVFLVWENPQCSQVREFDTVASVLLPHSAIRRERNVQVDPALRQVSSSTAAVQWILMFRPLCSLLI